MACICVWLMLGYFSPGTPPVERTLRRPCVACWSDTETCSWADNREPTVSQPKRQLSTTEHEQRPTPRRPAFFRPQRIVLAKGSYDTSSRESLVRSICSLYPSAEVIERLDTPHNRIDLGPGSLLDLHYRGKRTLLFGEHGSAVRHSNEPGNTCPGYWHFSPYGFCPYDCTYCYLAATPGVRFSPTVKIFLNLGTMLSKVNQIASSIGRPTPFYLGKLQDGLALDPLTGYSRALVPFFARHPFARMTLLTKSVDVRSLLDLDHKEHTVLSWSLNPPAISREFEANAPSPNARIRAMKACSEAGYPVRAVVMPVIPVQGWRHLYAEFITGLVEQVDLDRITLGGLCSFPGALRFTKSKLGRENAISEALSSRGAASRDGRIRYTVADRVHIYGHLISTVRKIRPDLTIGLCMEELAVYEALNIVSQIGRCNCVL